MTATDVIGYLVTALGAGGLSAVLTRWIAARAKDRAGERRERVELERLEAQREETGAHAAERAYDRLERLLNEERERCDRRISHLEAELEAYRLGNEALKERLAEAEREVEHLKGRLSEARDSWLKAYLAEDGEKPVVIGRIKGV